MAMLNNQMVKKTTWGAHFAEGKKKTFGGRKLYIHISLDDL